MAPPLLRAFYLKHLRAFSGGLAYDFFRFVRCPQQLQSTTAAWGAVGLTDAVCDPSPDTTDPAAPANLTATAGDGSVNLDWDDNEIDPDLDGYNVYRSTSSGGFYIQVALQVSASIYTDDTVSNGTTYYYVTTALDTSDNESEDSNEASATPASGGGSCTLAELGDPCVSNSDCCSNKCKGKPENKTCK